MYQSTDLHELLPWLHTVLRIYIRDSPQIGFFFPVLVGERKYRGNLSKGPSDMKSACLNENQHSTGQDMTDGNSKNAGKKD